MVGFEIIGLLIVALLLGMAAAKVLGTLAKIGLYILLGLSILFLMYVVWWF